MDEAMPFCFLLFPWLCVSLVVPRAVHAKSTKQALAEVKDRQCRVAGNAGPTPPPPFVPAREVEA